MSALIRVLTASACASCVAALVASCGGATFEAGVPGDGGSPSTQDGATPDADGAPSKDGSAHDAADGESPTNDGATDANGGADSSDGAPTIFVCSAQSATTTLFCADFDHVAAVGDGWSAPLGVNGGTDAFDTVNYRSPPNGYAATTPAITNVATFAALEESLPSIPTSTSLDLAFSLFMRDIDTSVSDAGNASATLVSLDLSTGASPLVLSLVLTGSALTLQQTSNETDGGTITQSGSVGAIATGAWTRVQIDVNRAATPWTITVKRDLVVKLSTNAIASPTGDTGVQLTVGIVYVAPPSAGYGATYDDVLLQSF
jgi:hypothetical protein